ncbi:hypothetical protein V5O48_018526, partial [Marasmius crinis-equi]
TGFDDSHYTTFLDSVARSAPQLTKLIAPSFFREVQWAWSQLTYLDISNDTKVPVHWLLPVLRQCRSLEILKMHTVSSPSAPQRVTLPRLITLETTFDSPICTFICAPELRKLVLTLVPAKHISRDIQSMLLQVEPPTLGSVLEGWLASFLSVLYKELCGSDWEGQSYDHIFDIVASSPAFLPLLEELVILVNPEAHLSYVINAIHQRIQDGRLRSVQLGVAWPSPDPAAALALKEIRQLGIDAKFRLLSGPCSRRFGVLDELQLILGRQMHLPDNHVSDFIKLADMGQILQLHASLMFYAYNSNILRETVVNLKDRAKAILKQLSGVVTRQLTSKT